MSTVKELLGFTYDPVDFAHRGVDIIEPYTVRRVKKATEALRELARSSASLRGEEPADVAEIYRRFMTLAERGEEAVAAAFESRRDSRKLAWSLCYHEGDAPSIVDSAHLPLALRVLDDDRSSVRLGVFDAMLRTWKGRAAEKLREFLRPWFLAYGGRRRDVLGIRERAKYLLERGGAVRLGGALVRAEQPLTAALGELGLPERTTSYPYFSEVAVAYTRTVLRAGLDAALLASVLDFLGLHDRSEVAKQCLGSVIVALDEAPDDDLRNRVQTFSFEAIGDPAKEHLWRPWAGATAAEVAELERARAILNRWIVQRFIVAFFNEVTIDDDRREFWLRYANDVSRFKVLSDRGTLRRLRADDRLRPYVKERFSIVQGSVSALMMQVRSKVIVEFSEVGNACYVYDATNPHAPGFDVRHRSVQALKRQHRLRGLLFRSSGGYAYAMKPEGRVLHHSGWQRRMRRWLSEFVGV